MAKRMTRAAKRCIMREASKHHKPGKSTSQAYAIGVSVCRAKGFRSIPKLSKKRRKK